MKILHIIPHLKKGGAERIVTDTVEELNTIEGVEVRLVVLNNLIEYNIDSFKNVVHVIECDVRLSVIRPNSIHVSALQNFIDSFCPDVIHSHLYEAEVVSRCCYFPKAKWFSHCHNNMEIFDLHNQSFLSLKKYVVQFYEKQFLMRRYKINGGTHFIAISKHTEDYIKKNGGINPVFFLANAINYKKFFTPIISKTTLTLIAVGNLNQNKNHQFLLQVATILRTKGFSFTLKIVGEGPESEKLAQLVESNQLTAHVQLLGSRSDVHELLKGAAFFVHAAHSEAFGLTLIEAMAAGLPVITLDGKGNRDVMEQGKNGYMIFDQNPIQFATLIIDLWANQNLYEQMCQYAQKYAKQFDIASYCDSLLKIYNQAKTSESL